MSAIKILAIVLIVAGIVGVMHGKVRCTKETHDAKIGPIPRSFKTPERVPAASRVSNR